MTNVAGQNTAITSNQQAAFVSDEEVARIDAFFATFYQQRQCACPAKAARNAGLRRHRPTMPERRVGCHEMRFAIPGYHVIK